MKRKPVPLAQRVRDALSVLTGKAFVPPVSYGRRLGRGGWVSLFDSGERNFQTDIDVSIDSTLSYGTVFAVITMIAGDVSKCGLRLMQRGNGNVWEPVEVSTYSPTLRKPNHYQTRQQFIESWQLSKQSRGNTYALKARDGAGNVRRLYILDPDRVKPLVAPNGDVFYQLRSDDLSRLPFDVDAVPASEVIHDRFNCLFHPLVGLSPLFAAGLAAAQGLGIQRNAAKLFKNLSRPGGILTAPGEISDETAARIKTQWQEHYGGDNIGKIAVLGDDLKFQSMSLNASDTQMAELMGLSDAQIARAWHVPAFLAGIGAAPSYDNVQALWQQYYAQCLQAQFEAIEALLDEAFGLDPVKYRTEFDLDDLLRMDTKTQAEVEGLLVQRGIRSPNEARRRFNDAPVAGGDTPYLQQQNFSLAALARRDAQDDPFRTAPAPAPAAPAAPPADDEEQQQRAARLIAPIVEELRQSMQQSGAATLEAVRAIQDRVQAQEEAARLQRQAQDMVDQLAGELAEQFRAAA